MLKTKLVEAYGADVGLPDLRKIIARCDRTVSMSDPRRAKSVEQARVIRAKAEVTIIDRDYVVVTLTRPGIGDVNSTSGPRLSR